MTPPQGSVVSRLPLGAVRPIVSAGLVGMFAIVAVWRLACGSRAQDFHCGECVRETVAARNSQVHEFGVVTVEYQNEPQRTKIFEDEASPSGLRSN